jgi:hypothetical protein
MYVAWQLTNEVYFYDQLTYLRPVHGAGSS